MMRVTLPDGLNIEAISPLEASVLFREIVAERTYERHGIVLPPAARIFDVGANIGLFAIHLARSIPGARIRAFEPVSATFATLQTNLREHAPGATAIQAGLAGQAGTAVFECDPNSSITASMTPAIFKKASPAGVTISDWAHGAVNDLARIDPRPSWQRLAAAFESPWARPLALAIAVAGGAALDVRKRIQLRREQCALHTLSDELAASGFDHLDLVKIDVEGAEEEVLRGISDADWPRIRQFVIEVHDLNGRRDRLAGELARRGYRVTLDQEDWALHRLMGISTIYAVRP